MIASRIATANGWTEYGSSWVISEEQEHSLHIPEVVSTRIDWRPFAIMDNTIPPRDPDDDEADEGEEKDDEEDNQIAMNYCRQTDFQCDCLVFLNRADF